MKKSIPLLLLAFIGVGVYLSWPKTTSTHAPAGTDIETARLGQIILPKVKGEALREGEKQDGILESQRMEFERTKDVALGYVPKFRLIEAQETLLQQRRANPLASFLGVSGFTWTERGSNSDEPGPYGNPRVSANQATSGRMRAIWVDLADPSNKTVWVGGVAGGIWKTNDITTDPATWTLVTDATANIAIGSITQSPVNTNIMYFGTGEKTINVDAVRGGGIWKSTDHGVTWNLLSNTTSFYNVAKVVCDPVNPNIVYVATMGNTTRGIQRSSDGGATWTDITPVGLNRAVPEMELSSTGRLHIVCGYYNGWFGAEGSGYVFTDNPSTVTSASWVSPTTTFTPTNINVDITVAGNTLYALPANSSFQTPQVWKSTDGGNNWAITGTTPPISGNTPLSSGQAWYNLAIAVDPSEPNKVMTGGLNSYISADGGATWSPNSVWVSGVAGSSNYIHADHQVIVWNNNQVLDGGDGGIFYSANDGITFSDRNVGLRLKQFYGVAVHPTSTNYFLAGAQDNGTHMFNTAGMGGSVEVLGGDGAFAHIDQDEPQFQFGSYVYSNYRRSTDGGTTWSNINFGNNGLFINPTDYDDVNNKFYGSWLAGQYLRWDNATTSTSAFAVGVAAFNGVRATHVKVSPNEVNRLFFGTEGGRVVRVDNAHTGTPTGTNITGSTMPTGNTVSCVAVGTSDNNLLATYSNYGLSTNRLFVSTTGGGAAGWTNITGNFPDIPVRWAIFHPESNTKAILGTDLGIYETANINGAATVWVQDPGIPPVRIDMLQYRPKDGLLVAATHGRGIFTTTIPLTVPYVRYAYNYNSKTEATSGTTGCRSYQDYTAVMNIDVAPTGTANLTIAPGAGTATLGVDYDFTTNGNFTTPSSIVSFASGSTTSQNITIRVYNDAEVESTETLSLTYTVGGGTNALAAPSSTTYRFTITDNDVAPLPAGSGTASIGNNNYGAYFQPFRSNYNDARSQYIYLASELTTAGIAPGNITALALNVLSKTSTQPYTGFTISLKNTSTSTFPALAFETGTTVFYTGNYSTVAGTNTFNYSTTPFTWDGTSNILVEICYDNSTATGTGDNVANSTTSSIMGIWNRDNTIGAAGCSLAAAFNGVGASYIRPDVTFTGTVLNNGIATAINSNKTENVGTSGTYYFYTGSNILNSITGASANLGCVSANLLEAGNTWQPFSGGERSQKVFEITPAANPGATYTIGLYFTNAELGGKVPGELKIAKTNASSIAAATGANTIIASTSAPVAFGPGWLYTATFTGFSKFFLVNVNVVLPITLLDFTGKLNNDAIALNWSTSSEQNAKHFILEESVDGTTFTPLALINATGNSSTKRSYGHLDKQVAEYNYYRLKLVDMDGTFTYSKTVLVVNPNVLQSLQVVNNPFREFIDIRLKRMPKQSVQASLMTTNGARLFTKVYSPAYQLRLDLASLQIARGTYLLQVMADGKQYVQKLVKQ
jgi:trimeric autotransporter adhesin